LAPVNPRKLLWRIVSALVLAPPALAAVWFGWPWLPLLVLLAVGGMGWEWARLCGRGEFARVGPPILLTGVLSVLILSFEGSGIAACAVALLGALVALTVAAVTRSAEPLWVGLGTLWFTLGALAFLWLARGPAGRETALWLLAVVWATDIGAYVVGRAVGGPRLAPRISPHKTWAGLVGGVTSAAVVALVATSLTGARSGFLVGLSIVLAVVAQLGDLAESHAKRHFGVKDASGLIPGHGGLLDRLDGLLAAAIAAALVTLATGQSPLAWR
jgi:phosphatidate cytidylyltransferase